ncbi:hypothetical protein BC828DRAFT_404956 [Blastocladiella britannica]|nr:hypothetical protein BC828DRAFT_404956 [Blastocladiella britannica]
MLLHPPPSSHSTTAHSGSGNGHGLSTGPFSTTTTTTSALLLAAGARRRKLADLKTGILGDPTHLYNDSDSEEEDEDEEDNDDNATTSNGRHADSMDVDGANGGGGEVARAELAAVAAYLDLTRLPTVEDLARSVLAKAAEEQRLRAERTITDVADLSELAPKRANADLKRELKRRTGALEQKTDAILYDILRKRVMDQQQQQQQQQQQGEPAEDLAAAVDAMEAAAAGGIKGRGASGRRGGRPSEWDDA